MSWSFLFFPSSGPRVLELQHILSSSMNIPDSLYGLGLLRMATKSDPGQALGQQLVAPGPYQRRESPTGLLWPSP